MTQDIRTTSPNLLDLRNPGPKPPLKKSKKRLSGLLILVFAGVLLAIVVVMILSVTMFHKKEDLNSVTTIKNKVGILMILPKDEEPALLTITDKSKVTTPFLSKSENGDKLLVYQNAKRVILYRPSLNKIVDVGPVSIAGPSGQ